jgi:hypothetical protein
MASPAGSETKIDDSGVISNAVAGYRVVTNTSDYGRFAVHGDGKTVVADDGVTFDSAVVHGNENELVGGAYYTDSGEFSLEFHGVRNAIRNASLHSPSTWGVVVRSGENTVDGVYSRTRRGVYVDTGLSGVVVSDSHFELDGDTGIRFRSGSTGAVTGNVIVDGSPALKIVEDSVTVEDNDVR